MDTTELKQRGAETTNRFKSRMTGAFYLVTLVTAGVVLFAHGKSGLMVDLIATVCYFAVTALFYELSR